MSTITNNHAASCTCFQCQNVQQQPVPSQPTNPPDRCPGCGQVTYPLSVHMCPGPMVQQPPLQQPGLTPQQGLTPQPQVYSAGILSGAALNARNMFTDAAREAFKNALSRGSKANGVSEGEAKPRLCTCDFRGSNCWNGCTCGGE